MCDIQSQLQEIVPRAAIYKGTNKSVDSTVHKVEYVTYPSNLSHVLEVGSTSSDHKVFFHISGNCLLDGKNSYFSVQLKTNKWTSCLSGDISSIFKRLTISLPSSGNQILEDIQEYNVLSNIGISLLLTLLCVVWLVMTGGSTLRAVLTWLDSR